MEIVFLGIGLLVGGSAAWFISKYRLASRHGLSREDASALHAQLDEVGRARSAADARAGMLEESLRDANDALGAERARVMALNGELSKAQADHANLLERLQEQKTELEQMQLRLTTEFKNIASEILEDKSKRFTEQNRLNLDEILKPLGEKLKDFEKKVEETYDRESQQRISLRTEISKLYELNQQITKEASNLTSALRGQSKVQGNWGEVVLERILEKSGLAKGREYIPQATITNAEGKRFQPDVIINLPENKNLVIDAKLSLTAYDRYCASEDEQARAAHLADHVASIKKHIRELGQKNYQHLYHINSPDFVLMFIPIEPAFNLALQHDMELYNEAFERNIVLLSTSTLMATLRIIASIWRQEYQNRNAMEIAHRGGDLYDKFVGFISDLEDLGKKLQAAQTSLDDAMQKLYKGKGNLIRRAEDMKQLGAKTSKALSPVLIERANTADDLFGNTLLSQNDSK